MLAFNMVRKDGFGAFQNSEVHGLAGSLRQIFQAGMCDVHQPVARGTRQPDQRGPQTNSRLGRGGNTKFSRSSRGH